MSLFNRVRQSPMRALANRVKVEENHTHVRATLTLPNGKKLQCTMRCDSPEALAGELDTYEGLAGEDDDVELAGFLKKLKKAAKKVANVPGIKQVVKAHTVPLKVAHKITHGKNSPIRKMEMKVQEMVSKNLPIAKPFIKVHNSLAAPVHKAIEGKKVKNKLTAAAIAEVTKDLPDKVRPGVQLAVANGIKQTEAIKSIGKAAVKAKVLSAAKRAAKQGDAEAKKLLKRNAQGRTGTYKVTTPSGRVVSVPASKVAR